MKLILKIVWCKFMYIFWYEISKISLKIVKSKL